MINLINYIRKAFCEHKYIISEAYMEDSDGSKGTRVYMRCEKCGYHSNHWKFLKL